MIEAEHSLDEVGHAHIQHAFLNSTKETGFNINANIIRTPKGKNNKQTNKIFIKSGNCITYSSRTKRTRGEASDGNGLLTHLYIVKFYAPEFRKKFGN